MPDLVGRAGAMTALPAAFFPVQNQPEHDRPAAMAKTMAATAVTSRRDRERS